ncbi:uncharacterized protein LOC135839198 isoform X2 [Planococcus citri]
MKFLSVALVYTFWLACALAGPGLYWSTKEIQRCINISGQENPEMKIWRSIIGGTRVEPSREEKCSLNCRLQNNEFFDHDGNLRNGSEYFRKLLEQFPTIVKHSDVLMAQVFQTVRSAKAINDKCERAFVIHTEIDWSIQTLRMASGIGNVTGIKDNTINILENRQNLDQEISQQREQYFGFFDALTSEEAKWWSEGFNISASAFCKLSKAMKTLNWKYNSIWHSSPSTAGC